MDIYGRNPVLEYLRALKQRNGARLFVAKSAHGKIIQTILSEARRAGIEAELVEKSFFTNRVPSSVHQGVLLNLPHDIDVVSDDAIINAAVQSKGVLVFLDRLSDPHNVGSIIRTAEALGAVGVALATAHASSITSAVVKSSAGATAHIPIVEISSAGSFIGKAKANGLWIIGTSSDAEQVPEDIKDFCPAMLIIGSEGEGVRRSILDKCDRVVRIPLKGKVASLNASVAAGILLYSLLRK